MSGGFGGGSWGGGAFGGSSGGSANAFTNTVPETVNFTESLQVHAGFRNTLSESVTIGEALTIRIDYRPTLSANITILESLVIGVTLLHAAALTDQLVELVFSLDVDPAYLPNFDPSNYNFSPGLTVTHVGIGSLPNTVLVSTSPQAGVPYQVTVGTIHATGGGILQPSNQTANFAGYPLLPRFFAAAQSQTKVVLIFSTTMTVDAAFTNPSNYVLTDLNGNSVPILSVAAQPDNTRAVLALGTNLVPETYYTITVNSAVHSTLGYSLVQPTDLFQWNAMEAPIKTGPLSIPFGNFSGEVTGGLLGQPAGQIFFSPALLQDAGNSIIQVDTVSLCTKAYDEYTFPQPVDPPALFTFSPNGPSGNIGPSTVLWSPAERQGIAQIILGNSQADTLPDPVDGPCNATLVETIDITKASFLNDPRWEMFPGTITFQTASNLAPIGPGPTTHITLE